MNIQRIGFDPQLGMVIFEFANFEDRSSFLDCVPFGEPFANCRVNSDGPPWRLSWKLDDLATACLIDLAEKQEDEPENRVDPRRDLIAESAPELVECLRELADFSEDDQHFRHRERSRAARKAAYALLERLGG